MFGFELGVMGVMIAVNALLAAYEIALTSVRPTRLRRLAEGGGPAAQAAVYMKDNVEASLAALQLGITLAGATAAAVGGAGADETIAPELARRLGMSEPTADLLALVCVVVPLTVVTIVMGELIPKVFALRNPERVCLALSPAIRWFMYAVWPAVWLFESAVQVVMSWGERRLGAPAGQDTAELHELRATASLARASRLIGHRQERIILGATELGSRPVRQAMLPAEDISTLDANLALTDALGSAHLDMHTRFPVVERPGDPQSICGYLNVKDLLGSMRLNPGVPSIQPLIRPLPSIPDSLPIADALERVMREHTHMALVRDGSARVVGMVTLEDLLEELVGEIEDEYDRLPSHVVPSGSGWIVGGGASLVRIQAATALDLGADLPPSGPANTLSAWVAGHLEREVRAGDVLVRPGVRVAVRKLRRRKVQEAQIGPAPTNPPPAGDALPGP